MDKSGENEVQDLSIPIPSAYAAMLVIVGPLTALLTTGHILIWGAENFFSGLSNFLRWESLLPTLVLGIPLHEFIHGATWAVAGRKTLRDIHFGFQWKSLAPYAHLKVPVQAGAYRAGAIMPALILGLMPYLIGIASGSAWFTTFGLFYIFAAGGDLVVLWLLRNVDGDTLVEDHPSRAGCYAYAQGLKIEN